MADFCLTPRQRQYLKGLAHGRRPHCQIGKEGLSEPAIGAIDKALADCELVAVQLSHVVGKDRKRLAAELADRLVSELVQVVGSKILLYRRNAQNPRIRLPL